MGNTNKKPSLDAQIAFIRQNRKNATGPDEVMYQEILENLISIKLWNNHPEWLNVDVERVITDLLTLIEDDQNPFLQNAEAAIGMLQSFKKTPKQ